MWEVAITILQHTTVNCTVLAITHYAIEYLNSIQYPVSCGYQQVVHDSAASLQRVVPICLRRRIARIVIVLALTDGAEAIRG